MSKLVISNTLLFLGRTAGGQQTCRQNHRSKFYFSHIHVFQSGIVIGNTNSWHKDSGLHQEKMIQFYPFTILKKQNMKKRII